MSPRGCRPKPQIEQPPVLPPETLKTQDWNRLVEDSIEVPIVRVSTRFAVGVLQAHFLCCQDELVQARIFGPGSMLFWFRD